MRAVPAVLNERRSARLDFDGAGPVGDVRWQSGMENYTETKAVTVNLI